MRLAAPLFMAAVLGLTACTPAPEPQSPIPTAIPAAYEKRVIAGPGGDAVTIPTVNPAYLKDRNVRQRVAYNGPEGPGTIVVDPYARFLYHVLPGGEAMRYGISVGTAGKGFVGTGTIKRKVSWPSWTPTANMVRNNPELYGPLKGGLKGGLDNPLGTRALYLYKGGRDTLYRIHGTMDPSSIGKATSAGCIRMFNQDIIDLFEEVPMGTRVVVRSEAQSAALEGPLNSTPDGYLEPANQIAAQPVAN